MRMMRRATSFEEVCKQVEAIVQKPSADVRRTIEAFFEVLPLSLVERRSVRIRFFGEFRLSVPQPTRYGLQSRNEKLLPEIMLYTAPKAKKRMDAAVKSGLTALGEGSPPRVSATPGDGAKSS